MFVRPAYDIANSNGKCKTPPVGENDQPDLGSMLQIIPKARLGCNRGI